MRLTWKDALATAVAGANVAIYAAFTTGTDLAIIDSVRGASGAILLLGLAGGCALSAPPEEYRHLSWYAGVMSTLGGLALLAGALGLIMASELALTVLFSSTIALWLIATLRHALAPAKTEVLR
ncbi:hypothetical protein [Nonomuraea gerenzanensis]|uniref:Integral membrane protein n=1 Tax=Nonomuraea gerenzanensis TaxID=93944 RepID=A0A1M4EAZ4_9ACTN|nr:hypothetical protein [Nonomuraea gerenzanensis]UBU18262.1 hypothetical protein LCN96_25525 [Nonomuraea gerenzanensis]SBO96079.1 hypothetical protein BN4615_P5595 [Nonomuraea gerenzanensis]